MSTIKLRIGGQRYDHTRALFDGDIGVEGAECSFESGAIVSDVFDKMLKQKAYDIAEFGFSFFVRLFEQGNSPIIALPVFPARKFRHASVFINKASGIRGPQDLAGKTIGELGAFGHDAGVWAKGALADDYGVTPDQCRWVIGGPNHPMKPFDFIPQIHPENVDIRPAPEGRTLSDMLEAGEIDALISAHVPQCYVRGSPKVDRLFPDYDIVESQYYKRTRIFPIMHLLAVRKEVLDAHPALTQAIYNAYLRSKDSAIGQYRSGRVDQQNVSMVPWFGKLFEENSKIFPDDWWPYGIGANRKVIDTFLRHHYEQGLSKRLICFDEIFHPDLLDT
ncbi:4,5-dihydroxyphthalate decarboxylase [Bradyrhizobium sp. WSM3983]|uniref:4,5-dihydroxyphthalate decarboxylase n=1 Tax=Bradyrhizobium sp. WSM3983 TaxID=1038867 RepID=UPI000423F089|nr:4,5-dihydroxyphthalate decarboxylase [Bradyrhizobium sp. WSM3983]